MLELEQTSDQCIFTRDGTDDLYLRNDIEAHPESSHVASQSCLAVYSYHRVISANCSASPSWVSPTTVKEITNSDVV